MCMCSIFNLSINYDNFCLFNNHFRDQIKCLVEDKKQLEKQHGFTIQVIGENKGINL